MINPEGWKPFGISYFPGKEVVELANKYLTLEDRKKISEMYESEARVVDIAYRIGCHPSTIYDELRRGDTGTLDKNQRHGYDPVKGQKAAMEAIRARGNRCKKV